MGSIKCIGNLIIGNKCDIASEVIFQTNGNLIGTKERHFGEGTIFN